MPSIDALKVGDALPARTYTPTNVSLFVYNAAIWNPHRIHYDEPYTTGVEKHPGVVVDGPLQGDWLSQVVFDWVEDAADVVEFEYSNRTASHLGDSLTSGGEVEAVDAATGEVRLKLFIKNDKGEVTTPGSAVVKFR